MYNIDKIIGAELCVHVVCMVMPYIQHILQRTPPWRWPQ